MSDLGTVFHIKMTKGKNAGKQYDCHAYSSLEEIWDSQSGEYIKIKFNGQYAYVPTSSEMSPELMNIITPMGIIKNGVPQYVLASAEITLISHAGGNGAYDISIGSKIKKIALYNAKTGALLGVAQLEANSSYSFQFYANGKGVISHGWDEATVPNSANVPILVKGSVQINKMPATLEFYDTSQDDH